MDNPAELQCPVCGYYCLGKGGVGCIDKPSLMFMTPRQKAAQDNFIDRFAARQNKEIEALRKKNSGEQA